jgi:hypothetical protein
MREGGRRRRTAQGLQPARLEGDAAIKTVQPRGPDPGSEVPARLMQQLDSAWFVVK